MSLLVLLVAATCLLLLTACDQDSAGPRTPVATPTPTSQATPPTLSSPTDTPALPTATTPAASATATPAVATAVAATRVPTYTATATATSRATPALTATVTARPASPPTIVRSATLPPTATSQPTATPTSSGGRYVFPVKPASAATYGQYHHDYPATDIFCPIGSTFVAPADGVVDFVSINDSWDPAIDDPATRGGLSVAIIGSDGVRYYGSHLSAIEPGIMPGVQVAAGQALGKTGHSGDARFVDPHLHFGISPPTTPMDWQTRRGTVSPYKYLRAWERGEPLRPVLPTSPTEPAGRASSPTALR